MPERSTFITFIWTVLVYYDGEWCKFVMHTAATILFIFKNFSFSFANIQKWVCPPEAFNYKLWCHGIHTKRQLKHHKQQQKLWQISLKFPFSTINSNIIFHFWSYHLLCNSTWNLLLGKVTLTINIFRLSTDKRRKYLAQRRQWRECLCFVLEQNKTWNNV